MKKLTQNLNLQDFSSNLKLRLSGISGAFMLPIATMAITGLFLSLGGSISSISSNDVTKKIGLGIRSVSYPIIQAFPLLLCISFSMAFTKKETGIAVWCSILAFFTFIYFQSAFITVNKEQQCCESCSCCSKGSPACCSLICCLPKSSFSILFSAGSRDKSPGIIHRIFGITTQNTSIFGPIIIGGILIPYIFKKFSEIQLPTYLSYFSGKRLLPLICTLSVIPLALFFLIFWPWIGYGISYIGNEISKSKGADSFFFGLFEKLLIPTGFHHIFASLFWYSPLGGDALLALKGENQCTNIACLCCQGKENPQFPNSINSFSLQGDALIGLSALALPFKTCNGDNKNVFSCFENKNIFAGRLTQGKFPIMQFALPAAALAILFSNKKEKRKNLSKTIYPGIWNSLILGITEPIEFTFMHSVPKLFYLFHSSMCGFSFLTMRLLQAHIPTSFSGGIIELIINGAIPYSKGTNFYWWAAVGGALSIIYFSTFYMVFSKKNKLEIESEESAEITNDINPSGLPLEIYYWKEGLGGWENVLTYKNCASRLRYDIKDKSKVQEKQLKKAGVIAIKWIGESHVQLIVGPKAEEINTKLLKYSQSDRQKK